MPLKACHNTHCHLKQNRTMVTIALRDDVRYAAHGMADKYTDGCLERFINACINLFLEEEAQKIKQDAPQDQSGAVPSEPQKP
jgi:hypothetical protein